ncbi:MAG: hypothetical protein MJZ67_07150 [Bacteroidales bacterium]|nr:hypothetical protein [Bacteroidales bacterium]
MTKNDDMDNMNNSSNYATWMLKHWWLWPGLSVGSFILCFFLVASFWKARYAFLIACIVVIAGSILSELATIVIAIAHKKWKLLGLSFVGFLVVLRALVAYCALILGGAMAGMFLPDDHVPDWAVADTVDSLL